MKKFSIIHRILAVMMLAIAGIVCADAQTISVAPLEIEPGEQRTMEVILDNSMPVNTVQFDMHLPEGLSMVGDFEQTERFPAKMSLMSNLSVNGDAQWKRVAAVPSDLKAVIAAGKGAVIRFTVQADQNLYDVTESPSIRFDGISFTINSLTEVKQPYFTTAVMKTLPVVEITAAPANVVLAPGQTREVTFSMRNNVECSMLSFWLHLPKGLSLPEDWYTFGSRVNPTMYALNSKSEGDIKIVLALSPTSTNVQGMEGYEGEFITIKLLATDAFTANGNITVSDIEFSTPESLSVDGTSLVAVEAVCSTNAKNSADAKVKELQTALDQTLVKIGTECPDVKEGFTGEAIQQMINNLKSSIDTAFADGTLVENYDNIMSATTDIEAAISKLLQDAKDAQTAFINETERQKQNQTAYDADCQTLETLQAKLNGVQAECSQKYPAADMTAEVTAAQNAINKALEDAAAAYKAVEKEGTYSSPVNAEALTAQINKILVDAQAKQAEADRLAANKTAYDADLAKIAELENNLKVTIAEVQSNYPGFDDPQANLAVETSIAEAKKAVEDAYAAVANEGTYTSPLKVEPIQAAIDALLTNARLKADESARQAANKTAYEADLATVAELQNSLTAAEAKIAADYPAYTDKEAAQDIATSIADAKKAIETAYAAVATEGIYTSPLDADAIRTAITNMLGAAQAAQAAADKAEADRQAANKTAFDADMAKIAELEKNLKATIAEVQSKYPGFDDPQANLAVETSIAEAKKAVEDAYAAVANEGTYTSPLNVEPIQAAIDALLTNARLKADESARQAANKTAYEADLATVVELQNSLTAAEAKIAADYPAYTDKETAQGIATSIADAKKAIETAYAAVATEGIYTSPLDADAIRTAITNMLGAAQAAQAAADKAEADRQAANKTAYEADLAKVLELRTLLNTVWAKTSTEYPEYADIMEKTTIENLLLSMDNEIKKAYDAVATEGEYQSPLNYDELEERIEMLYTSAVDKAEAARQEANKEAYDADIAKVDSMQQALDEAMKVTEGKPEFDDAVKAVQDKIDALRKAADDEFKAVETEGKYESQVGDTEVNAVLDEIKVLVEQAGIGTISVDNLDEDVMIFTVDGQRHDTPVRGQINIICTKDGKIFKTIVK